MFQKSFEVAREDASNSPPDITNWVASSHPLRDIYKENCQLNFYSDLPDIFLNLNKFSVGMIPVFGTTPICVQTFSKVKIVRSMCMSRVTNEHLPF